MALPTMTANSPSAGYISWAAFSISYGDANYSVAAGNTNLRFVWWRLNGGSPVIEAGNTVPQTLTDDDVVLFGNKNGVPIRIQSTSFVDGDLVIDGSIIAKAIASDAIVARHILAGVIDTYHISAAAIEADQIAANAISASKIAAGAITTDKLTVASVGDTLILNGTMTDYEVRGGIVEPIGWIERTSGATITGMFQTTSGINYVMFTTATSGSSIWQNLDSGKIPCATGQQYYVEATMAGNGGIYNWRPIIYCYNRDNTLVGTVAATTNFLTDNGGYGIRSGAVLTVTGTNAHYFRVAIAGYSAGGSYYCTNVSVNRVTVSARIADGAITADKILAGEIKTNHLEAKAIKAEQIDSNAITAEKLDAEAIDGKSITGVKITGPDIQTNVEVDRGVKLQVDGIRAYRNIDEVGGQGKAGDRFFAVLPNEGVMIAEGESTVSKLTVKQPDPAAPGYDANEAQTSLGGKTEMPVRGSAVMQAATQPPAQAPTCEVNYLTYEMDDDGRWASRHSWNTEDGLTFWTLSTPSVPGMMYIENYARNTGVKTTLWTKSTQVELTGAAQMAKPWGVVARGSFFNVVLTAFNRIYIQVYRKSDGVLLFTNNQIVAINQEKPVSVAWDAVNSKYTVVFQDLNNIVSAVSFTQNTSSGALTVTTSGPYFSNNYTVADHWYGTDPAWSGPRWLLARTNGFVVARDPAVGPNDPDPANSFTSGSTSLVGFTKYGSSFMSVDSTGLMRYYSDITTNLTKYVTSTFARLVSGSVTKETVASPVTTFTMPSRSRLTVTAAGIPPNSNGADDPNYIRIYAGSTNTNAARFFQTSIAQGSKTTTLPTFATSGAVAPTTGTFLGTVPYKISAATAGFTVDGNSNGTLGTGSVYTTTESRIITAASLSATLLAATTADARPAGEITMWGTTAPPTGWLICNGQEVSRTTYARLFAVIGTAFGLGDSTTTFAVPDLRGRLPVGAGTNHALRSNENSTDETTRSIRHRHNITGIGNHRHALGITTTTASNTATTGSANRVATISGISQSDLEGAHDHGGMTGVGALTGTDAISHMGLHFIIRAL